jgi:hypothetical protein
MPLCRSAAFALIEFAFASRILNAEARKERRRYKKRGSIKLSQGGCTAVVKVGDW